MHDLAWLRAPGPPGRARPDRRPHRRRSSASGCGGPRARDVLQRVTDADVSNEAFPYLTRPAPDVGEVPVFAQRISYAGELGWELYGPMEMGERLLGPAVGGRPRRTAWSPAGGGAFDSLRLEKGYRLWGQDINIEHDPFEAGIGFAVRMSKRDFQGQAALERDRARGGQRASLCVPWSSTTPRSS